MKRRLLALLMSLVMILSVLPGAAFAEPADSSDVLTYADLADIDSSITIPDGASASEELSVADAVRALLLWTGMSEKQLGTFPADYLALARSMGMISADTDTDAACTLDAYRQMKAVANTMYDALHADKVQPLYMNGMAQPIFPYTTGSVETGYSNADSDIIRYCVYVETNYDTDDDGKLDLVKAVVQVPRAAVEGNYKAATIYEARPYITGCNDSMSPGENLGSESYDISKLYSQPAARTPAGSATTAQAAANANSADWYYWNPSEGMYDYEDLEWYDYYLVRGFAVVECGGLGTKGSDGFETCGTDLEIDAFKCVIEWLHGDRVAYTDKTSNITIAADWSSGKVGMTGRSYAGTTQFGLATTGVAGLETIVPVAGIASWYEYTNSQGISTSAWSASYSEMLAWYCNGRYLDPADYATIAEKYGNYLYQIQQDQLATNGDYSKHWATRDYTLDAENIKCPALIVHGLNDDNVRTKEFDLMYQAYQKAGVNVKLLLHQDAHLTPSYPAGNLEFYIDGESYNNVLNRWFSHYLCGVENGAENMAAVTAQDSHDASVWHTYDSWDTAKSVTLSSGKTGSTTINSDYSSLGINSRNWRDKLTEGDTAVSAMYTMPVKADTVIKGSVAVNFSASVDNYDAPNAPRGGVDHDNAVSPELDLSALDHDNYVASAAGSGVTVSLPDAADLIDRDALMVSAMLVDIAPEGKTFKAFNTEGSYVPKDLTENGAWMGGGLSNYDYAELKASDVSYKIIARGWMDLCNPGAGYNSASADTKVALKVGENHDYTIYLQPNLYTVEEGHTLALVIYTYEQGKARYSQNYQITLDNGSVNAVIPVDQLPAVDPEPTPAENPFKDVKSGSPYYDAILWAVENKVTNGITADTFGVNDGCTRAQIVTFLYRAAGSPSVGSLKNPFTDVKESSVYRDAIVWAASTGITNGTAAETFDPNAVCTRGQIVTFLFRASGDDKVTSGTDFTDVAADSYCADAVAWAVANGVTKGTTATTFAPNATCTRGQAVTLIYRASSASV